MTDALGSVLATFSNTAGAAAMLGRQLYSPYGIQRYSNGSMGTNKGFTGQYNDPVTSLDYYGSRYYDPVSGVFLSADSVAGNVAGMNPYGYVGGNPETYNDPTGNMYAPPQGGGGGGGNLGGGSSGGGYGGGSGYGSGSGNNNNPGQTHSWPPGLMQTTCRFLGDCKVTAQTHEPTLTPVDVNGVTQSDTPVCTVEGFCVDMPTVGGIHIRVLVQTNQTGLVQVCVNSFVCLDEGGGEAGAAGEGENGQNNGALGGDRWYADSSTAGDTSGTPEESLGADETTHDNTSATQPHLQPLNNRGQPYPQMTDPRTGEEVPFPEGELQQIPEADRVVWNNQTRYAFIQEWYQQGYPDPEGGWGNLDIHHILPREYGGTNDFWNLVPLDRGFHQQVVTPWWNSFVP
jgi:RHS repeat-associated protein